ncbi:hypothetical protein [Arthrobacter sp. SLBN-100]|nr:hypothetical protein [Arthrobacter sp. SLBN-100]
MSKPKDKSKSGDELYEIVLAVEELLGGELSGEELAELVNAADPPNEGPV